MMVVAYQTAGLQAMYHCVLLIELPVEGFRVFIVVPPAVEPYSAYRAVVGQQFSELAVHKTVVSGPVGVSGVTSGTMACAALRIVLAPPVEVRVVQVQFKIVVLTCL